MSVDFPQRHKVCFVNFRIWQAMRVAIHTQIRQAMRVLIHTHISCRLLVEGSAPKPLEHRISFCGCAFCERFQRVRQSAVPFKMPWNKSFPPYCLTAAVKHSSPRLMCGQNAYLSFSFTPHPVFCFFAWCVVKRDILW